MNEFTAKKTGEVLAFLRLADNTFRDGEAGFTQIKSGDELSQIHEKLSRLTHALESITQQAGQSDVTEEKAGRTLAKITRARNDYINGRWDDTVELYEWLSFNAGAGSSHSSEVAGAAESLAHEALGSACDEALTYFDDLLAECKAYLHSIGKEKALA